tara:strand:+ start:235 stop:477 length:243 start_codon:yes stop_codon:yes gene_type:complete
MKNISWIDRKHRKIIDEVIITDEDCGVYLKRPWIFSVSEASCTFFCFDDFEYDMGKTFQALNECIEIEAVKIKPEVWDKG